MPDVDPSELKRAVEFPHDGMARFVQSMPIRDEPWTKPYKTIRSKYSIKPITPDVLPAPTLGSTSEVAADGVLCRAACIGD
jgi:hypothetical protein